MRTQTVIILLLLATCTASYGQDGSDIRYFKIKGVDSTLIGQYVHLDFFNRSFGGRTIDTIKINIDNKTISFIEVRKDDGFNNWFSRQYLQSLNKVDGLTARISKFRLDGIAAMLLRVTIYLDFYGDDNKILADKSRQIDYLFDKKDIEEVLVKAK